MSGMSSRLGVPSDWSGARLLRGSMSKKPCVTRRGIGSRWPFRGALGTSNTFSRLALTILNLVNVRRRHAASRVLYHPRIDQASRCPCAAVR